MPVVIVVSSWLLVPLVQYVVRPRVHHSTLLGFVLGWAPDFVVAFCFPFSILMRPRVWTERTATILFTVWSVFTLVTLVLVEFRSLFGPNVYDPDDIAVAIGGVALAALFFQAVLRPRLKFAEPVGVSPVRHA